MLPIPQVKYNITNIQIRIDADLGQFSIQQPRPTQEIEQVPAKLDIRQKNGDLTIDQSKAWDALARTNILEVNQRIYSQAREIALQGIAKIVEKGNRLAAIHLGGNPIAEMAQDVTVSFPEMNYAGEASYDNVDISYRANKPEIQVQEGGAQITARVNPPEMQYERGKFDFSVQQYPKIEFIPPPQIDTRL